MISVKTDFQATVVFMDRLESVKFLDDQTGQIVDPRFVLTRLASGDLRINYSKKVVEGTGPLHPAFVASESWTIVGTKND